MKNNIIFALTFFTALVVSAGCSKDDKLPVDPAGTVILNMLTEEYGGTNLSNSDLYINDSYNFYSETLLLSNLGKKSGLGAVKDIELRAGTNTAAVVPGYAYQAIEAGSIEEFPSGQKALDIRSVYYNIYVDSEIIKEGEVAGAVVKYTKLDVPDNGLPKYDTDLGTLEYHDGNNHEIVLQLPTSDFEYFPTFLQEPDEFEHVKEGNKLIIRLLSYYGYSHYLGFYIRIGQSYTYVYANIEQ